MRERSPRCLDVELTARCNLGCRYCYLGSPSTGDMTEATAQAILDYLQGVQKSGDATPRLNLYGGEPFLNFSIVQMLARGCREIGGECAIFTNGATASDYQIKWCMDMGVTPRRSCAGCPDSAAITRPGDYTDRWLDEGALWKDYHATHRITVTPETACHMSRSVAWLHFHGYDGPVDFQPDEYAQWSAEALAEYEDQMDSIASEFVRLYRDGEVLGIENLTNYGRVIFGQGRVMVIGCGAGTNTAGVTWDGGVVPCHRFFREPALRSGHISDMLAGRRFADAFQDVVGGWIHGTERSECVTCSARQCCSRGCPHVALRMLGTMDGSTPAHCKFVRLYASLARRIQGELGDNWWRKKPTQCKPFQ